MHALGCKPAQLQTAQPLLGPLLSGSHSHFMLELEMSGLTFEYMIRISRVSNVLELRYGTGLTCPDQGDYSLVNDTVEGCSLEGAS